MFDSYRSVVGGSRPLSSSAARTGGWSFRRAISLASFCLIALGCGTNEIDGLGMTNPIPGAGGIGGDFAFCGNPTGADAGAGAFSSPGMLGGPVLEGLPTAVEPPPPVSGGTMAVLRNGTTVVAADSDRDRVYIVDLGGASGAKLRASISLAPRDQPGRVVEDGAGRVHVVLRNGGGLVTVDPVAAAITMRRSVCALPRGLAYDATKDRLLIACAGGELITMAPTAATAERTIKLQTDLRDVVVDGSRVLVTRFRSAETLVLDAQGVVVETIKPVSFSNRSGSLGTSDPFAPSVAWRTVAMPGGGAVMVHQRGMDSKVRETPGGYGGLSSCDTIVHTSVTKMKSGERPSPGPAMPGFVLPVDLALSADGKQVAMISAGNGHAQFGARKLFVANTDDVTKEWDGDGNGNGRCDLDDRHAPSPTPICATGVVGFPPAPDGSCPAKFVLCGGLCEEAFFSRCGPPAFDAGVPTEPNGPMMPGVDGGIAGGGAAPGMGAVVGAGGASGNVMGMGGFGGFTPPPVTPCFVDIPGVVEPVSVGFAGPDRVLVQSREPAELWIVSKTTASAERVSLSQETRADMGHTVFHSNSGGGLACASCHPEGHEDGRVWTFDCEGRRRTQDVAGGLSGTEPFHWNGDLGDFPKLVDTVFVRRMSGPQLSRHQMMATLNWINTVPANPPLRSAADAQVQRGKALFDSPAVACGSCHAGRMLTNNATVDVGTSAQFQVPSLRGVGWRAPFMHDGCAPSLAARFGNRYCDGGDAHGRTSQLTAAQIDDLVAFLESL